ncbi:hypothetical protein [Rhodococcus spongiicola]|uniref:Uncharacterized protein n=1 Tax=Rhodococcus spongiicola TaxID=2487352 RepID=A0A3S3AE55_9NOCA|nr:hypothetical protein [Rhodococcus spongiicola]RVW02464.1 hypothetical protein EF834_12880 [Rhodococcus spongiicola]
MSLQHRSVAIAALAGAALVALAPIASAATTYQITAYPPIGTVYSNNITTLAVTVTPTPTGEDATTPVTLEVIEPDGEQTTRTVPLTLGFATVATPINEPGRYTAVFSFAPPQGEPATTTLHFDVTPSPIHFGSAS